ncbi:MULTISPECIES: hypothetical protein [unclassified Rhodosalinus]|uniref:hypothetical protein n=1 Tax=unclassified Rhodosalinus TaxID=2630183 RepID=UPI0035253368
MSSPDPDFEKQKKRHWPTLIGIAAVLLLVIVAMLGFGVWDAAPIEEQAAPGPIEEGEG